jgi:hypothetical protein
MDFNATIIQNNQISVYVCVWIFWIEFNTSIKKNWQKIFLPKWGLIKSAPTKADDYRRRLRLRLEVGQLLVQGVQDRRH